MGVKYVRYADDFSIYCQESEAAQAIQEKIYRFLQQKLHLPVNEEKSGIRAPEEFTILGYSFERSKGRSDYRMTASVKSRKDLKAKLKEVTRKTTPYTFNRRNIILGCQRGVWKNNN